MCLFPCFHIFLVSSRNCILYITLTETFVKWLQWLSIDNTNIPKTGNEGGATMCYLPNQVVPNIQ